MNLRKFIKYENLKCEVKSWNDLYRTQDANLLAKLFIDNLKYYIEKNTISVSKNKIGNTMWITKNILKEIKEKNKLYKILLKQPNNIEMHEIYERLRNKLKKLKYNKAKQRFSQK